MLECVQYRLASEKLDTAATPPLILPNPYIALLRCNAERDLKHKFSFSRFAFAYIPAYLGDMSEWVQYRPASEKLDTPSDAVSSTTSWPPPSRHTAARQAVGPSVAIACER